MAESAFPRRVKTALSLLLIIGAFAMYWGWGLIYGSWNIFDSSNMGVYAIFVILLAFGVFGLILVAVQGREQ
jgi:MFS-type transporter involved in bile tolerance (Atg22 family)